MEDDDLVGILVNVEHRQPTQRSKGRRSFYELPKTLSEEDDTFGVLNRPSSAASYGSETHNVDTDVLVQIESSQSSTETSLPSFSSSLRYSLSEAAGQPLTSSLTSSLGNSLSSFSASRFSENLSHISPLRIGSGFQSTDDVFLTDSGSNDSKMPDWNMIMNEAQFLALSIQEKPNKTPVQKISAGGGLLGNFSPCEGLDSPGLDMSKDTPPEGLLELSLEKSPVKDIFSEINRDESTTLAIKPTSTEKENIQDIRQDMLDTPKKADKSPLKPSTVNEKENVAPKSRTAVTRKGSMNMKKATPRLLLGNTKAKETNVNNNNNNKRSPGLKSLNNSTTDGTMERTDGKMERTDGTESAEKKAPLKPVIQPQNTPLNPASATKRRSLMQAVGSARKPDLSNVKSKISTGRSIPPVKGGLPARGLTPLKQPAKPQQRVESGMKPALGSAARRSIQGVNRPQSSHPPTLQRQGSGLSAPPRPGSSATPTTKARQSLSFTTPRRSLALPPASPAAGGGVFNIPSTPTSRVPSATPGRRIPPPSPTRRLAAPLIPNRKPGGQTAASGLKPSNQMTPSLKPVLAAGSRLGSTTFTPGGLKANGRKPGLTPSLKPSVTPSLRPAMGSSAAVSRLQPPSRLAAPKSSMTTPKTKGGLRFSGLPSPQVERGSASLVCSTPAISNPCSSVPVGLPSPIGVKRRQSNSYV